MVCGTLAGRIGAAAAGSTLDLSGCIYTAGATVTKSLTISGGTLNVPAGAAGLTVAADGVTINGMTIAGSNSLVFASAETGISANGVRDLTISNSDIGTFGYGPIYAVGVTNLTVTNNRLHDAVYAGVMVISGAGGRIEGNTISRIGVNGSATMGGNAYGVALTDLGGPVTSDFVVTANTITDIPTWHGLDTHGGARITFSNNTISRVSRGIFITTDGNNRGATAITISSNQLLSPAPITTNLQAITLYSATTVSITGNTVSGWGTSLFYDDYGKMSVGVTLSGNIVTP
ncbi:MAG: right-handed parallel beta-helix repeat-containing protein [Candidatus Limnocylindrales bacterium]